MTEKTTASQRRRTPSQNGFTSRAPRTNRNCCCVDVIVKIKQPFDEKKCDLLFDELKTPPLPVPAEKPKTNKYRFGRWHLRKGKKQEFICPPKFPLLDENFYILWCNHRRELQNVEHQVDDSPPPLFPELYLKPRRLNYYGTVLQKNMTVNKQLIKRINNIQKLGGFVDCWLKPEPTDKLNVLLRRAREKVLEQINKDNVEFFKRLQFARSEQWRTKELDEEWKRTKEKLIMGASLPFILFKTEKIDRDIKDPAFDKPPGVPPRTRVLMDFRVHKGANLGRVIIELFTDIVPNACQLFLSLVKGDTEGHAYTGTRIFRVAPGLYCRGGDVEKDNGFGTHLAQGSETCLEPENFTLKHTVPGVLSMSVSPDCEIYGQFNIIFKPLPQLDDKNVVFGRIVSGPSQVLERISALGLPLGTTVSDIMIHSCGYFTRSGNYRGGLPNTIKFPSRGKKSE